MKANSVYQLLPDDTSQQIKSSDNLYLNMYKYGTYKPMNKRNKISSLTDEMFEKKPMKQYESTTMLDKINRQMSLITNAYKPNVLRIKFQVENRLIIGNSGGNYGNVSIIAIHPTYCIPYIPSSAIKGAFRSYMIYSKYNGDEAAAKHCENFIRLFGVSNNNQEEGNKIKKGRVIFLDAFPMDKFVIEQDVQTVHFSQYYKGESYPRDDIERVPIKMYTVGKTVFLISVIYNAEQFDDNQLKEFYDYFKETFTEFGIGAKTSLGYGLGNLLTYYDEYIM